MTGTGLSGRGGGGRTCDLIWGKKTSKARITSPAEGEGEGTGEGGGAGGGVGGR